MAVPPVSLDSLVCLVDTVPDWLTQLNALATQVVEQQSRIPQFPHYPGFRLVRKKHDSTESLRPKHKNDGEADEAAIIVNEISLPSAPSQPSSPHKDGAVFLQEVRRKRKPNSCCSGASGPQRYRTRSMIVVYYDSMIQEAFEHMVRSIAAVRNQLRKGRQAVSFKARMASLNVKENPVAAAEDITMLNPKSARSTGPRSMRTNLDDLSAGAIHVFEEADNHLEAAQGLCEVAAHQFLRDGDCDEEIQGIRTRLENCLRLAQKETESWRQKGEEAEGKIEDSSYLKPNVVNMTEKVDLCVAKPVNCDNICGIEVDDDTSDTSSLHIHLNDFRRVRRI